MAITALDYVTCFSSGFMLTCVNVTTHGQTHTAHTRRRVCVVVTLPDCEQSDMDGFGGIGSPRRAAEALIPDSSPYHPVLSTRASRWWGQY